MKISWEWVHTKENFTYLMMEWANTQLKNRLIPAWNSIMFLRSGFWHILFNYKTHIFIFLQAQVGSNMKGVDEGFISKRSRRSFFQPQEGIMKIYWLHVIQFKMNLSRLEVFHTNIIVIMFFMRELLVPYARLHIIREQALCFHPFPSLSSLFFHALPKQRACSQARLHTAKG